MSVENIINDVLKELERSEKEHGNFNSPHEGYAVILEELDELWENVKLNPKNIELTETSPELTFVDIENEIQYKEAQEWKRINMMREEAVQVAAMAIKFIHCICYE
jgi:hypothetical protein